MGKFSSQVGQRIQHETGSHLEIFTSGVELLWGNYTVFPVPVQETVTGGTKMKVYALLVHVLGAQNWKNCVIAPK